MTFLLTHPFEGDLSESLQILSAALFDPQTEKRAQIAARTATR